MGQSQHLKQLVLQLNSRISGQILGPAGALDDPNLSQVYQARCLLAYHVGGDFLPPPISWNFPCPYPESLNFVFSLSLNGLCEHLTKFCSDLLGFPLKPLGQFDVAASFFLLIMRNF